MGATISSYSYPQRVYNYVMNRKRKLDESDTQDEMDKIIDIAMHTPKRKKLCSTVAYIYQALFVEGRDSDVTVVALGEEFPLHKVYLSQSPYFASMFGGNWKETGQTRIHIDVVDPFITKEALHTVLGALYSDEVKLEPLNIVSVLATATMLQLGGLIDRCCEVMLETINPHTALHYYEAACQYGDLKLKENCFQWFLVNLITYYSSNVEELKTIPISLMENLTNHSGLCVVKTEITLYILLKQWMYMQLHENPFPFDATNVVEYFSSRKGEMPLLLTELGSKYERVFRALRMQHLISHHVDVGIMLRDNIIPRSWIESVIMHGWKYTLMVNENEVRGPEECTDEEFLEIALRCGRFLPIKEKNMWRWTGFHYGLDLIMIADDRTVSIKRNHRPEYELLLSLQTIRYIIIRVTVHSLNQQKQITYTQTSGIHRLPLNKSEEIVLMTFPPDINFPLVLSANILFTTPFSDDWTTDSSIQSI